MHTKVSTDKINLSYRDARIKGVAAAIFRDLVMCGNRSSSSQCTRASRFTSCLCRKLVCEALHSREHLTARRDELLELRLALPADVNCGVIIPNDAVVRRVKLRPDRPPIAKVELHADQVMKLVSQYDGSRFRRASARAAR